MTAKRTAIVTTLFLAGLWTADARTNVADVLDKVALKGDTLPGHAAIVAGNPTAGRIAMQGSQKGTVAPLSTTSSATVTKQHAVLPQPPSPPIFTGQYDFYSYLYQTSLATKSHRLIPLLLPVTANREKHIRFIVHHYKSQLNIDHPAIAVFATKEDGKGLALPYVLRWSVSENKYIERDSLPVDEPIVIVHDPNRMTLFHKQKTPTGETEVSKYHQLKVGVNGFDTGWDGPVCAKWDNLSNLAVNVTFRFIGYNDKNVLKDGTHIEIGYPAIRIPTHYSVQSRVAEQEYTKSYTSQVATFTFASSVANIYLADGTEMPMKEYDPASDQVICIPVDGYSVDECDKWGMWNAVRPAVGAD